MPRIVFAFQNPSVNSTCAAPHPTHRREALRPHPRCSQELLGDERLAQTPILVLGNKIDIEGAVSVCGAAYALAQRHHHIAAASASATGRRRGAAPRAGTLRYHGQGSQGAAGGRAPARAVHVQHQAHDGLRRWCFACSCGAMFPGPAHIPSCASGFKWIAKYIWTPATGGSSCSSSNSSSSSSGCSAQLSCSGEKPPLEMPISADHDDCSGLWLCSWWCVQ